MLIDPTYLRYIVDGLGNQSIHQENMSDLPQGLIGIYDEAFSCEQQIQYRSKILEILSALALLKKEVSACFISHLLKWQEQEVIYTLNIYTKWFNSPTSGTYILYHERLRAYLLSKTPSGQLNDTNHKIITSCQQALESKKGDEWETYALEHLPSHLLIPAMQDEEQGKAFRKLVYDNSFWNRQLEISKGYDWSKKMLNLALGWAAKRDTNELIECALNKVDLNNMEQNDAPRIVELVAQNDIETALQRIESFGGNDKEGLQRKFTLYMFCLMELSLLDSKGKSFRKNGIEKILNHLGSNTPVDHSILNWSDFFPSYLMFQMACEWAEMGLDYLMVYKKTDKWEFDWIQETGPYNNFKFEILISTAMNINDINLDLSVIKSKILIYISSELTKQMKFEKASFVMQEALESIRGIGVYEENSKALEDISTVLVKKGQFEEALKCAHGINDEWDKSNALAAISTELAKQGNLEGALECARSINRKGIKSNALAAISTELANQGKLEEAAFVMHEALEFTRSINSDIQKSKALCYISTGLAKQMKLNESASVIKEAFECTQGINENEYSAKSIALNIISTELAKQEKFEEALECARGIISNARKRLALHYISIELAKQSRVEESFKCVQGISGSFFKSRAVKDISIELAKQGKFEEALECVLDISDNSVKFAALHNISIELAKQEKFKEAIECARTIREFSSRIVAMKDITTELVKYGALSEVTPVMNEILQYDSNLSGSEDNDQTLKGISIELAKQGKFEKALKSARAISSVSSKTISMKAISKELAKQGKFEEALECARTISSVSSLSDISTELHKQGKLQEAISVIQEAIECALTINGVSSKSIAIKDISTELVKQEKFEEAVSLIQKVFEYTRGIINDDYYGKSIALHNISIEFARLGKIKQALECAGYINNSYKSFAINGIATELAKQGGLEDALEFARSIEITSSKINALKDISTELFIQGKFKEATSVIQETLKYAYGISDGGKKNEALAVIIKEMAKLKMIKEALECARGISEMSDKSCALKSISIELAFQQDIKLSSSVMQEALECARGVIDESDKSSALKDISIEATKLGDLMLVENITSEIPKIDVRQNCWREISKAQNELHNIYIAFESKNKLQSYEAKFFYLAGWVESIKVNEINNELASRAIKDLMNDSTSLQHFLQVYAQHELFFGFPSQEKVDRLNKTLNLQWALNIIKQFP